MQAEQRGERQEQAPRPRGGTAGPASRPDAVLIAARGLGHPRLAAARAAGGARRLLNARTHPVSFLSATGIASRFRICGNRAPQLLSRVSLMITITRLFPVGLAGQDVGELAAVPGREEPLALEDHLVIPLDRDPGQRRRPQQLAGEAEDRAGAPAPAPCGSWRRGAAARAPSSPPRRSSTGGPARPGSAGGRGCPGPPTRRSWTDRLHFSSRACSCAASGRVLASAGTTPRATRWDGPEPGQREPDEVAPARQEDDLRLLLPGQLEGRVALPRGDRLRASSWPGTTIRPPVAAS